MNAVVAYGMIPFMSGMGSTGVASAVLDVFELIATWFVNAIVSILPIFYTVESGLTILGVLACCSLALATILLVVAFVKSFFHWRS